MKGRRGYLRALGIAAVGALAGCSGGSDGGATTGTATETPETNAATTETPETDAATTETPEARTATATETPDRSIGGIQLAPADRDRKNVGVDVSLSDDTALVGARGAADVFVNDGEWTQQTTLTVPDAARPDAFGRSVALDGDLAVVGERPEGDDPGRAHVFEREAGGWRRRTTLAAPEEAAGHTFATTVVASGSTVVVGGGGAHVYARGGGEWAHERTLTPRFGDADPEFGTGLAVEDDVAVVGDPEFDSEAAKDAAFVFERGGGIWSQQTKISDSNPPKGFGLAVAITDDAALIGEPSDAEIGERVEVWNREYGNWNGVAYLVEDSSWTPPAKYGDAVALTDVAAFVAASHAETDHGKRSGAVFEYDRSGEEWGRRRRIVPSSADRTADGARFGSALDADRGRLLVGAPRHHVSGGEGSGVAYVFETG